MDRLLTSAAVPSGLRAGLGWAPAPAPSQTPDNSFLLPPPSWARQGPRAGLVGLGLPPSPARPPPIHPRPLCPAVSCLLPLAHLGKQPMCPAVSVVGAQHCLTGMSQNIGGCLSDSIARLETLKPREVRSWICWRGRDFVLTTVVSPAPTPITQYVLGRYLSGKQIPQQVRQSWGWRPRAQGGPEVCEGRDKPCLVGRG